MKAFFSLSFTIAFSLIFFACRKPHTEGPRTKDYYVNYKMNGIWVTNTKLNYAWLKPNAQDPSKMLFQMTSNTNDFKDAFCFSISKPASIDVGSYSTANPYYLIVDYFKDIGNGSEKDYSIVDANNPSSVFNLSFTSITAKDFTGSFTGNLYAGNELMSITEGQFFVKRNP
jgi:hypothetical protein